MKVIRLAAIGIVASFVLLGVIWGLASAHETTITSNLQSTKALVGTVFTFQGQLTYDDQPVDDLCLMRFELYDAATDGNQVGSTFYSPTPIPVQAGIFSIDLDFGNVFDGTALWLDIAVQCTPDSSYASIGRQKVNAVPYAINSDLLDNNSGDFYRNASNLNSGSLTTDRFSAWTDLSAEGYLANQSGDIAQNNGTLQTNLDADLLDGIQGGLYERAYAEGTVVAGATQVVEIPNWYPFTIQLASGWPDYGGVAFITGMENDHYIAITYIAYNGDGTSATGGAECYEGNTTLLLQFGSSSYVYRVRCPGEISGVHNLVLEATGVELRYKVIY
jgi:hypothetical protein